MAEKNRRILQGADVIYPFTRQENVIGLQGTIVAKLPIISSETPQSGFVNRQVWLDTSINPNGFGNFVSGPTPVGNLINGRGNTQNNANQELGFGEYNPSDDLGFGAF